MELIMIKDVEHVGQKGDVVRVRDGFGRNFLIPRRLAMLCTLANREFVEDQKKRTQVKREKAKVQAEALAEKLSKLKIKIDARAGENDKLFGAITNEDIRKALETRGHQFDKKVIHLNEAIHQLGTHQVSVEIVPGVKATLAIEVVKKA